MLDLAVIVLVTLFTLFGVVSGLLLQGLRFASAVIAGIVAFSFTAPVVHAWPGPVPSNPAVRNALFPALVFGATYLVLSILSRLLVHLARKASPGLTVSDRLLGGIVGALKGLLLSWALVWLALQAEDAAGRKLPALDTGSSKCAAVVREWPVDRFIDIDRVRGWLGFAITRTLDLPGEAHDVAESPEVRDERPL